VCPDHDDGRSPMSRLIRIAAAGTLAGLLVACGGGQLSHEEYQQKLDEVRSDLEEQEEAFTGLNPQSFQNLDQVAELFSRGADASDRVADELDGVDPPDDAAAANEKIVTGMRTLADLLNQFAEAADQGDLQKIQELGQQFQGGPPPEIQALEDAIQELRDAGYNVPQE
jgi:hypothetical protein